MRHQLWAENKSSAADSRIHMIKWPGTIKGLCKTQIIIFKRNSILLTCFFSLLPNEKMIWRFIRPSFFYPIQTGDKDQKDGDQNCTHFAMYKMNYLSNISVIIYSASRGSQCICSLKHPSRCKGTPEATKPEHFLNQREEKNRSCFSRDVSLVHNPTIQRCMLWCCTGGCLCGCVGANGQD